MTIFSAATIGSTAHLEMMTTANLRERVRRAWNFATAAERERQRETTNDDAAISEIADEIEAK